MPTTPRGPEDASIALPLRVGLVTAHIETGKITALTAGVAGGRNTGGGSQKRE